MKEMEQVGKMAEDNGYQILVKTYPHDYVFYDEERNYNGVYRRLFNRLTPQYKVLESHISNAIVVDSQDHFSAISFSDVLFNMSGSHVAWETYFTKTQSFSMNYVKQIYYGGTKYIPSYITLPDGIVNIEVSDSGELFSGATRSHDGMENYISKDFSLSNIAKEIKHIMEK
jgi:hypothetical protein